MKRVVSRVIHRTGLFVAVLGPDGVGKSSLIRRLPSLVEDAFRSVRGLHLRPAVLPLRRHDPEDATHPHESPPYGSAKTVAKLVYLLVDYVVGYAIGVWPSLVRSTLVLADRYVDDIAVDPRRYRLSEITPLLRLIRRVCPSPDLEMVLFAPPHVLLDRKQEVTSDELRRLSERYRSLDTGRPDVVVIDATAPEGKVAEVAARAVLAFLAQRTAARIGP